MKILIDNGHGVTTPGKRSPGSEILEYKYTREIAGRIVSELRNRGYDAERIVPEEDDISLGARCQRVNKWCDKLGAGNVVLVSVHLNAAGSGAWLKAGGWCCYTTRGKTNSDTVATWLYEAATKNLVKYAAILEAGKKSGAYDSRQRAFRTDYTDGDPDQEADFYIIKHSRCPAVLTENLFMDNKSDVAYLLSEEGKQSIVDIHVQGIINYIKNKKK